VPALKDSRGSVIAALSHANEFTNSISRIVTIGLSAEGLELSIIKDILSRMETLKLSIEKKIEIAKKDQEKLYVVIDEVIEEINDDDIRTDIRYFDDNGKESKLMKTIKTLLEKDDNNNSRDAFIKSYL